MKFFLNLLGRHLAAAVLQHWGSTAFGCLAALVEAWPNLQNYFHGDFSKTDWPALGAAAVAVIWGSLSKNAFNWKAILGAITNSAPRAELFKLPAGEGNK